VRVWDFFRRFLPSVELDHLEYAKGFELQERMPLWVKPTQKVGASPPPYHSPPDYPPLVTGHSHRMTTHHSPLYYR
jgi:hypothetical protein